MTPRERTIGGVRVPAFFYGTAWKEGDTRHLVRLALAAGFRGFDTANQRKHFHEVGVGEALAEALAAGQVQREALFIQTKFTHRAGQDHRLPYDPDASIAQQVQQSCNSSLTHLGIATIDSYVLHGPSVQGGLAPADLLAWQAMEDLHAASRVRLLGVSNVSLTQLDLLCARARVQPSFVQNRCYARTGWDRAVRGFCRERGIMYQGFSLLTANRAEIASPALGQIAARAGLTRSQAIFSFALAVGMIPLTGTRSPEHMQEDLSVFDHALSAEDLHRMETLSVS